MANAKAFQRLNRARTALIMDVRHGFYGALAIQMPFIERPGIETMATDGKSLYFNPDFVLSLPEPVLCGVLAHEVEHPARCHHVRRGGRDPREWNVACDLAINPDLLAAGFRLPDGALYDKRFVGMSAESIYAARVKERQSGQPQPQPGNGPQGAGQPQSGGQPQPGAGQPQNGQGGQPQPQGGQPGGQGGQPQSGGGQPRGGPQPGGQPQPGQSGGQPQGAGPAVPRGIDPAGCGGVLDAADNEGEREEAAADWQAKVRHAAMVARAAGEGRLPAHVARIIGELDKPRRNPWREIFRRFADDSIIRDYTWTRPNRRFSGAAFILPGMETVAPAHIVWVVDDSGSMDVRAVRAGLSEAQAALDDGAVERVTVVYCNTGVGAARTYTQGETIDPPRARGGGTRFAPAFAWVAEHAPDASAIVYATDLDCSDYGPEPHCPVLWANTEIGTRRPVPFGEVMDLDPDA